MERPRYKRGHVSIIASRARKLEDAHRRGSLRASGTGFVVDHAVVTATDGSYFPSRDPRQISNERLVTGLELFEGRDI